MTEGEVNRIINDYVKERNLVHPDKKRKVICDARLKLIFRRKTVNKNSIWGILEPHFAENLVQSELVMREVKDFMVSCNNLKNKAKNSMVDCNNAKTKVKDSIVACNNLETSNKDPEPSKIERAPRVRLSKFAAMVPENIKLLYLKRSLVFELFKQHKTSEDKVIGSFVRVKLDRKKRNSFQLMQVTGIKKGVDGEEYDKMILLVSDMPKEVFPSMLSNDDFTEVA